MSNVEADAGSSEPPALVTGGTAGIGLEVARGLARSGRGVVIVGRDRTRGEQAANKLRQETRNSAVWFAQADLSLVAEADRLADLIRERFPALGHLVHAAGFVRGRRVVTSEALESNFAVNYLARFVLTQQLLPLLVAAGRPARLSRIIILGGAARNGPIRFDDPNMSRGFTTIRAIKQFAHANDVFTVELARRLAADGESPVVTVSSIKIGVVKTGIRRDFPLWMRLLVPALFDWWLARTPHEVGAAAVRLALAPEYEGLSGGLYSYIWSLKKTVPSRRAGDAAEGTRLWTMSEQLVNSVRKRNSQHRGSQAAGPTSQ